MILIFSISTDVTTDFVVMRLKTKYIRINTDIDDVQTSIELCNQKKTIWFKLNNGDFKFKLNDIKKIWYRRGHIMKDVPYDSFSNMFNFYFHTNVDTIRNFISRRTELKTLGSYSHEMHVNKLLNIHRASDAGILVPPTLITSHKEEVQTFLALHKKIIIKPIKHPFSILFRDEIITPSSGIMLFDNLNEFSELFPLTLFQKYIEKKFELRIFFIGDEFFTAAIFSQSHEDSKIDYRDGNPRIVRMVPFKLSEHIVKKLVEFRNSVGLNTGSIDMIIDPNDDYYFLEVNPSGQFLGLSQNCNYKLTDRIARFLDSE
ncbi:hypothetical protein J4E06_09830 [Muricauda sp. NFXS6]|uniref:MvdC/MvdD family ATP grasp protein n=1 Tax=Allomuricauda sp. NFXS6 TaxID=2819094 RepID=UPI0032DF84A7